jgi:hypothetical protein
VKLGDFSDQALRKWAEDYMVQRAEERRKEKRGVDDLRQVWREMNEADWEAFKALLELRPRARARYSEDEIALAIQRHLAALPRIQKNGVSYGAPWTFAAEVSALRRLLGEPEPERTRIETIDFQP